MKVLLWRVSVGFAVVLTVALAASLTERPRERRHARRPQDIADRLLQLAKVSAADVVYDLECGDGTLSVTAARTYGARTVCLDVYPRRIEAARALARSAHVEHLITFTLQDWETVDVSPASVIVMFKTGLWRYSAREQLTRQARPGTRIVSYARDMGSWAPTTIVRSRDDSALLMLWVADGTVRPSPGFECGPVLAPCR